MFWNESATFVVGKQKIYFVVNTWLLSFRILLSYVNASIRNESLLTTLVFISAWNMNLNKMLLSP